MNWNEKNNQIGGRPDQRPKLYEQFQLLLAIREFFRGDDFLEVMTPPMVANPGMEVHIHPFQVQGLAPQHHGASREKMYLHTSPEFYMKELLSSGHRRIFNLSYCFRHEPHSSFHRPQFIMLEWYRALSPYQHIMNDVEKLIIYCANWLSEEGIPVREGMEYFRIKRKTVQQIFKEFLDVDILDYLEKDKLINLIKNNFSDVPLPPSSEWDQMEWDDFYFLLFLNKIEPRFKEIPGLLLYEFPAPLCALSVLKKEDPRVCLRFEVYLHGVELCNCFQELTNLEEQRKRFQKDAELKTKLYKYTLPSPDVLYKSLERGLPQSCGIALGVERLLMALAPSVPAFWDQE